MQTVFNRGDDGKLHYVDMLRGLAILGVLLVHSLSGMTAAGLDKLPLHLDWLMSAGRHGVELFFVVSAFTLFRSMHNRVEQEHMPIRRYFLRRFFRIAPVYYFVLIVIYVFVRKGVVGYVDPQNPELSIPDLAAHMLFLNGLYPFFANDFFGR
jgi:peptidoglycan/LPS O-acetylase OafA/YrhL